MKKTLAIGCALFLLATAAACGGGGQSSSAPGPEVSEQIIATEPSPAEPKPQSSEAARQPEVDLEDFEGLRDTYLFPITYTFAPGFSWADAEEIGADALVSMYAYSKVWNADIPSDDMEWEGEVPYYYVDAKTVEDDIKSYFIVTTDFLETAGQYDAQRMAYRFNMSGVGWAYSPEVLRGEQTGDTLILYLNDGAGGDEEVSELTLQLSKDGSFQYISNRYLAQTPQSQQ